MRLALILIAVAAFLSLGVLDLSIGNWTTGVASLLLAIVNLLLLT